MNGVGDSGRFRKNSMPMAPIMNASAKLYGTMA